MLLGMKILLEIVILVGLNLFLFGYLQRELLLLVVAQKNQIDPPTCEYRMEFLRERIVR